MHFSGPPHLRAQAVVPHSALELCLQLEVAHDNEALAVDPQAREVSVVVKVMAIIMMANAPA